MRERNISEREILECVRNYQIRHEDKSGNPVYKAEIGSRRIKVVIAKDDSSFVITVAEKELGAT